MSRDQDIADEIQAHLDERVDELVAAGMARADAEALARRQFGNVAAIAEEAREVWRWRLAWDLLIDLRLAARTLRKSPTFTVVAVITLALGIGANSAIFSVVNAVLLRPLPFPDADRLVEVFSVKDGVATGPSPLDARDLAAGSSSFERLVVYDTWRKNLSAAPTATDPEQIRVGLVPREYFEALGLSPVLGRLFTPDENRWGSHHVAVLTTGFWRSHFGADPDVVGKRAIINDEPYTIVGVVPDTIPSWMDARNEKVGVFTPFAPDPDVWSESSRGGRGFAALGRLRPGVPLAQARTELGAIAARLAQRYPVDAGYGVSVEPLAKRRVAGVSPVLALLTAAAGLMLLIACANIANLFLARNGARRRELAIRTAIGAGRSRLVRQLLVEAVVVALAGGAAGVALAWLGIGALARLYPPRILQLADAAIDLPVLLFTLAVALVTSIGCGILPALAGTRVAPADALQQDGRAASPGRGRRALRRALVAAEVAFALMLLIGAGLLLRGLARLEGQALGFREDHLLTEHLFLPEARYPGPDAINAFCDRYAGRIRALAGVADATVTDIVPPAYRYKLPFTLVGRPASDRTANFGVVDPHYRGTLGARLLRGRDFSDADAASGARVALVNETFARRFLGGEDPIGKQIDLAPARLTIIGVVEDVRNRGLAQSPDADIIALFRQNPEQNFGFKSVVVRTTLEPSALAPALRRELAALDPDLPFAEVRTMDDKLADETANERLSSLLLAIFAGLGVAVAVVGVYGVVAYGVSQRRREIATRIVLGASTARVVGVVAREALVAGAAGLGLGLAGALALARVAASLLHGVSPMDPLTFMGSALLLALTVAAASVGPCRRAAALDPLEALRVD
jgi:putative ABC transport system permease protein